MIRFCQESDLERVCEIAKKAWTKIFDYLEGAYGKELYNTVNPDCRNSKTPWVHSFFAEHPDWLYVAERNGQVVGFIGIMINPRTKTGTITKGEFKVQKVAGGHEVRQLWLLPDRQRRRPQQQPSSHHHRA